MPKQLLGMGVGIGVGELGVLVYDTFTDDDETIPENHTPDINVPENSYAQVPGGADWRIRNNGLINDTQSANGYCLMDIDQDATKIEATIIYNGEFPGIVWRANSDMSKYERMWIHSSTQCRRQSHNTGEIVLGDLAAINNGDEIPIVITIDGNEITIDINDGEIIVTYDDSADYSDAPNQTFFGLGTFRFGASDTALDDFRITAI